MATGGDRDSRLNGARNVGLSNTRGNFRGRDLDDLVRFSTTARSNFTLGLSGVARRNNLDVELYQFKRPVNTVLRSIGRIDFRRLTRNQRNQNFQLVAASRRGSNAAESITRELDAGNYFVRTLKRQGNATNYRLSLTASEIPTPPQPPIQPPEPPIPPQPPVQPPQPPIPPVLPPPPPPIPLNPGALTNGSLATTETSKRYVVNLTGRGDYQFKLAGLSADADLRVFSADGTTVLKQSTLLGNTIDQFLLPLESGQYFVDVFRKAGNTAATNFNLRVDKRTDTIANTEAGATLLGNIGAPGGAPPKVERVNYVLSNGIDSPVDFYRFTIPNRGFVKVSVEGAPGDGGQLFGDLDVDIYPRGQAVNNGLSANSLGTGAEVFGGTLDATADGTPSGTPVEYLLRVAPKTGTPDGSTYRLVIEYTGRSSIPSIVRDILPGAGASGADNFTDVNGLAYFSSNSLNAQRQEKVSLWSSAGTLTTTAKVFDFDAGTVLDQFTAVGGRLYFTTRASGANPATARLWTSDGTTNGTREVSGIVGPDELVAGGTNTLYFSTSTTVGGNLNQGLFRIAQGGTTPERITGSFFQSQAGVERPFFDELTTIGGDLYFAAADSFNSRELWRVAASGTTAQKMVLNSDGNADPTNLVNADGVLFLTASVKDPVDDSRELIRINNFVATPAVNADYTVFGLNGTNTAEAGNLSYIAGTKTLYFSATDTLAGNSTGSELFKLDFNVATTEAATPSLVQDINAGTESASPSSFVQLGNRLLFLANDGATSELWVTEQTATGSVTSKLSTLTGLSGLTNLSGIKEVVGVNNTLFFVATDGDGEELRKVTLTGTTAGELVSYNIRAGSASSSPNSLAVVAGQVFFVADNGENGTEPWSIPA